MHLIVTVIVLTLLPSANSAILLPRQRSFHPMMGQAEAFFRNTTKEPKEPEICQDGATGVVVPCAPPMEPTDQVPHCGDYNGQATECGRDHAAYYPICNNLIESFRSDPWSIIPDGTQHICWNVTQDLCCASWSRPVKGMARGAVYKPAKAIYDRCRSRGVSGSMTQVKISVPRVKRDACIKFCLSNRADGCKDSSF